jgi:hypothetical protein
VLIQLIFGFVFIASAGLNARAGVVHVKPNIQSLDLSFACNSDHVKTIDECYYLGVQELNIMGCHLRGDVNSNNCDVSADKLTTVAGQHVRQEWVCSVPSVNCKENFTDLCPLNYKRVSLLPKDVLGNGKVFLNFLTYCQFDASLGRKDPTRILQNQSP